MYCTCEDTRDEFGGCVPGSGNKCLACGKIMTNKTIIKYKKRMLKEFGWEREFEDTFFTVVSSDFYPTVRFRKCIIARLFEKYIDSKLGKVKVKCKDGCIQIERIK